MAFTITSAITIGSRVEDRGSFADAALDPHHFLISENGSVSPLHEISVTNEGGKQIAIEAGNSQFSVSAVADVPQYRLHQRQEGLVVRPRRVIEHAPVVEGVEQLDPPQRPRLTTFAMPIVTIATSIVMAAVTTSWMFLIFGASASLMGMTFALSEVLRYRREKKKHDDARLANDAQRRTQQQALLDFDRKQARSRWPLDVDSFLRSNHVWETRIDHNDFLSCVVGTGLLRLTEECVGSPVFVHLLTSRIVVIQATRSIGESVLRQLLMQICLRSGPSDVCIDANGCCEVPTTYGCNPNDESHHHVSITDDINALGRAASDVRQRLLRDERLTVIALAEPGEQLPSCVEVVIRAGQNWKGEIVTDAGATQVHLAGVSAERWQQWSSQLSELIDPECRGHSVTTLPRQVRLGAVARASDNSLRVSIGESTDGRCEIDLVRDGPHMLVAGTTGSGKSEFLRSLITSLCLRYPSSALHLVLIDFKGGATFDEFRALPHVADVVSDLDVEMIERMLGGLQVELTRREHILRAARARDISDLRSKGHSLARLVVIVDEFAVLAHQYPEQMKTFTSIAAQGRSLGFHLVLASQRVSGAITDDVQANVDLRIAFRVTNAVESRDIVGSPMAADISKLHPGRAIVAALGNEIVEVQVAAVADDDLAELGRRCEQMNDEPARRPWSDPLPADLLPSGEGCGLIDVPEQQSHVSWVWSPHDGRLSIEGNVGSGTTTTLMSVLHHNSDIAAYVVDARGDERLLGISDFPNVAPVVFAWDHERRGRLLNVLAAELESRKKLSAADPLIVAIDGVTEFIRQLNDREVEVFRSLLREGDGVGVHLVTTGAEPPVPAPSRITLGGAGHTMRGAIPGRGVLHRQGEAIREIQIRPSTESPVADNIAPPTIQEMPEHVEWRNGGGSRRGSSTVLDVGVKYDDLSTGTCEIRDGRHLLVIGPSGSGRTTAIRTLVESWKHVRAGVVSTVSDQHVDDIPIVPGPHLVVVDDADHTLGGEHLLGRLYGTEDLTVIASVDPLHLRISFDHWTQQLRKSHTSILMTDCANTDADLVFPGRLPNVPIRPRPGLGWVISGGATTLVQIAAMLGECQLSRIPSISSGSTTPSLLSPVHQLA